MGCGPGIFIFSLKNPDFHGFLFHLWGLSKEQEPFSGIFQDPVPLLECRINCRHFQNPNKNSSLGAKQLLNVKKKKPKEMGFLLEISKVRAGFRVKIIPSAFQDEENLEFLPRDIPRARREAAAEDKKPLGILAEIKSWIWVILMPLNLIPTPNPWNFQPEVPWDISLSNEYFYFPSGFSIPA